MRIIAIISIDFIMRGIYTRILGRQITWIAQQLEELSADSSIEQIYFQFTIHLLLPEAESSFTLWIIFRYSPKYPKIKATFSGHTHFFNIRVRINKP